MINSYAAPSIEEEYQACKDEVMAAAAVGWQNEDIASNRCPLTNKLVNWIRYQQTSDQEDLRAVIKFIDDNPNWPDLKLIQDKMEQGLPIEISEIHGTKRLYDWFNKHNPVTPFGAYIYAKLIFKYDSKSKAISYISKTWRNFDFYDKLFKRYLNEFGQYLTEVDHNHRANRLLWNNNIKAAKKVLPYVQSDYRKLCEARIALLQNSKHVVKLINNVPKQWQNHPGLMYARVLRARKVRDNEFMWKLLRQTSMQICRHNFPNKWWKERNILARRYMEQQQFTKAYNLVKNHCQISGIGHAEAEFLAGWLALKFLKQPKEAFMHFLDFRKNVSRPISTTRGDFWLGEASDAMGKDEQAKKYWEKAAKHPGIYYGQIALARLDNVEKIKHYFKDTPDMNTSEAIAFKKKDLVKVLELLYKYELTKYADRLISDLAIIANTRIKQAVLMEIAEDNLHHQVLIAKKSIRKELPRMQAAFPVVREAEDIDNGISQALAYSIIRQESRFKHDAISSAGASGLMQLMPATAKKVAKKLKISQKPLSNKSYNIKLGSSYLRQMLDKFDGSLVLAVAAYNAGPGAVNRWIDKYYGHPLIKPRYDIIDWIELIPYHETRNYVQRVLENYIVYRQKFGLPAKSMLEVITAKM